MNNGLNCLRFEMARKDSVSPVSLMTRNLRVMLLPHMSRKCKEPFEEKFRFSNYHYMKSLRIFPTPKLKVCKFTRIAEKKIYSKRKIYCKLLLK